MLTKIQDGELIGQCSTDRPNEPATRSSGRIVPVMAQGIDSIEPIILLSPVIKEAGACGLKMFVGTSGADALHISHVAIPLGDDVAGFVVLYSVCSPSEKELRHLLKRTWRRSTTTQQAGSRLLLRLDRDYDPVCAFVGTWKEQIRELTYFATGFESLSAFNVGWPHRAELAIERTTEHGLQKMTFGVHRFSERERWLLYTKTLVDVSDPVKQPFNSVGIIQYACDTQGMRNDLWVEYLLELGLKAHNGFLPAGSILVSIAPEEV